MWAKVFFLRNRLYVPWTWHFPLHYFFEGSIDFIWLFRVRGKWQHSGVSHHATSYSDVLYMNMLITGNRNFCHNYLGLELILCLIESLFWILTLSQYATSCAWVVSSSFLEVCWVTIWWHVVGEFWSVAWLMASGCHPALKGSLCLVAPPALRATEFFQSTLCTQGWDLIRGTVCIFPRRAILFIQAGREKRTCSVMPGINSTPDFD